MAKRKNAKSLFEVISNSPRPAVVPPAAGRRQDKPAAPAPQTPGATETPRTEAAPKAPGRAGLALNQFQAASIAVGVVLLLALAFLWGRSIGNRPAGGAAGNPSPLGAEFINGSGAHAKLPPMVTDDYPRKRGWSYLVIHENVASYNDGLEIKRFFHENGVDVTVNQDPSLTTQFVIEDTHGVSSRTSPEADKRALLIRTLCWLYMTQSRAGLIPARPYDFKKVTWVTER